MIQTTKKLLIALVISMSVYGAPPKKAPKPPKAKPVPVSEQPAKQLITKKQVLANSRITDYTAEQEIMLENAKTPLLTVKLLISMHKRQAELWAVEKEERLYALIRYPGYPNHPRDAQWRQELKDALELAKENEIGFAERTEKLKELKKLIEAEQSDSE